MPLNMNTVGTGTGIGGGSGSSVGIQNDVDVFLYPSVHKYDPTKGSISKADLSVTNFTHGKTSINGYICEIGADDILRYDPDYSSYPSLYRLKFNYSTNIAAGTVYESYSQTKICDINSTFEDKVKSYINTIISGSCKICNITYTRTISVNDYLYIPFNYKYEDNVGVGKAGIGLIKLDINNTGSPTFESISTGILSYNDYYNYNVNTYVYKDQYGDIYFIYIPKYLYSHPSGSFSYYEAKLSIIKITPNHDISILHALPSESFFIIDDYYLFSNIYQSNASSTCTTRKSAITFINKISIADNGDINIHASNLIIQYDSIKYERYLFALHDNNGKGIYSTTLLETIDCTTYPIQTVGSSTVTVHGYCIIPISGDYNNLLLYHAVYKTDYVYHIKNTQDGIVFNDLTNTFVGGDFDDLFKFGRNCSNYYDWSDYMNYKKYHPGLVRLNSQCPCIISYEAQRYNANYYPVNIDWDIDPSTSTCDTILQLNSGDKLYCDAGIIEYKLGTNSSVSVNSPTCTIPTDGSYRVRTHVYTPYDVPELIVQSKSGALYNIRSSCVGDDLIVYLSNKMKINGVQAQSGYNRIPNGRLQRIEITM